MKQMKTTDKKGFGRGFAVPGMLLNITIGGMLVAGTGSLGLSSVHKVARMASFPGLNTQCQAASSMIAQDVRRSSAVERASSEQVVLTVRRAQDINTITYTYDAARRTLTRTEGATTQTVLRDVDSFGFSLFQRPAASAAFDTFAPATPQNARIVGCHWSCSRKVAGAKLDSESVQMAPMVLRNRC